MCNSCGSSTTCDPTIHFKMDGSYLVPYVGQAPQEPIDLAEIVIGGETDTRLQLDSDNKQIIYTGERASQEGGTPDIITIQSIASMIELGALSNIENSTPNNGDTLVYNSDLGLWQPGGNFRRVAAILDGDENAAYRYTITTDDLSGTNATIDFYHNLGFIPTIEGQWWSEFAAELRFPLPWHFINYPQMYWAVPPSATMNILAIDDEKITIRLAVHDTNGLSYISANYKMRFKFYCYYP